MSSTRASSTTRATCRAGAGPALADLRYEPALQPEIRRLDELRAGAIEDRVQAELDRGEHARLVGELETLVAEHPLRERLRAQQMVALYRAGRHAGALAAFQNARTALDELGLAPGPELRDLEQAILTHDPALAAPAREDVPPAPPTPTFGRETEVRDVVTALEGTRLLTLVGPGGVGKTRLAVEVARAAGGRFVPLASTAGVVRIPAVICDALGVARIPAETDLEALDRALDRGAMLLVLDNLEHLPGAGALIADLLDRAHGLTILATSREPLRIRAERLYPVAPLPPDGAEAMFTDRARARDPAFAVTPAVSEICRRVDGLPLAIELAAARLGLLGPDDLASRLGDALAVLDRGPLDAPERHRTLRATLDWSFDLLDDAERDAFTALGAFAGGCDLGAAEAVTGSDVAVLESLVAKSLIDVQGGRLAPLEPVRQYAAELLAARPDADAVHGRHLDHYLELAEAREARIWALQRSCPEFAQNRKEHDNFRAAAAWGLKTGRSTELLRLASALSDYGWFSHTNGEVAQWLDLANAGAADEVPPTVRARATLTAAKHRPGDRDELLATALLQVRAIPEGEALTAA